MTTALAPAEPDTRRPPDDPLAPGLYGGLSRRAYDAIPALNFSVLKHCRQSPAHARHRQLHPEPQTPAQALGSLVHCYLLEPARFATDYVPLPDLTQNLKTKGGETPKNPTATAEYKARLAEFGQAHMGRTFVSPDDMAVCRGIGDGVAAHRMAAGVLSGHGRTDPEAAVVWTDPETGLACKALIDLLDRDPEDGNYAVDLKSVDDASPGPFARLVASNQWHTQAAFYCWGLSMVGWPVRRFLHVAVECKPPFGVAVYELDDAALDQGIREFRAHLDRWHRCVQDGHWPAYADRVEPLSLPKYAFTGEGL
jgi:exodeoxyribonuclease VIII